MHRPSPVIARLTAACSKSHGCRHLRWIVPSVRTYILKKWAPDITSTRSSPLCRRGTSTFERKGGERAAEEVAVRSEGSPVLHRALSLSLSLLFSLSCLAVTSSSLCLCPVSFTTFEHDCNSAKKMSLPLRASEGHVEIAQNQTRKCL